MNTIVTHFSPDVDCICSVWLIKRFLPHFRNCQINFVPAGSTYQSQAVDGDPKIIHADTGFGKFDHHQTNKNTCSAVLVFEYLKQKKLLKNKEVEVLKRLVIQVNEIDHFHQVFLPNAGSDRNEFFLDEIIDGLKLTFPKEDLKIIEIGESLFEAIFKGLSNKVWAEELIAHAIQFKTVWGKALGLETTNDKAVHLAQKLGFKIVVRKDPQKNYVRIKSWPVPEIDLTEAFEKLKQKDKQATWFLHVSKHMVLNGSTKNPTMRPTKLSLEEIIEIIKKVKR